jgi:hypothetical protein
LSAALRKVVVILLVMALVFPLVRFLYSPRHAFFIVLGVGAVVGGAIWLARRGGDGRGRWLSARTGFLCDRCKLNDVRYCSRPERPNATRCPDFRER